MKKKKESSRLSLDKETLKKLNEEQLSGEELEKIEGGVGTVIFGGKTCCCVTAATTDYTSCVF